VEKVLIIGGTRTVGKTLFHSLLMKNPEVIWLFSRGEHKQFILESELGIVKSPDNGHEILSAANVRFLIGDVRLSGFFRYDISWR
jgi:FlaA1/EpsC-like NDP-sugar epimerase